MTAALTFGGESYAADSLGGSGRRVNGVAGSLYERTGLTSAADMAGFVIRSEINYQADRIRRLPGGDELVHYAGITWSLTRQQAAINAEGVRDWGQSAATSLAVWGGEGNGFAYWAGLTLGNYIEGGSNLVSALLVDPLSTAQGLAGAVEAHYRAGGALAVAGMFTGGLEIYEWLTSADFLSGEALSGDQRFDRSLAGISGIAGSLNGSSILKNAARHGVRATLEEIATAPKNVLLGAGPVAQSSVANATPEAYAGVRQASQYLQASGVPRHFRKQALEAFDRQAISVRIAGDAEYAIRYFDNINAWPKGRFLFDQFPATRNSLALPPHWNQMTHFRQFQIRPGTTILEGPASRQGFYPGGQVQKYIPNLDDLIDL